MIDNSTLILLGITSHRPRFAAVLKIINYAQLLFVCLFVFGGKKPILNLLSTTNLIGKPYFYDNKL